LIGGARLGVFRAGDQELGTRVVTLAESEVVTVAKNKRSPALFEVINRAQTQGQEPRLEIPRWWRSNNEAAETDKNLSPPVPQEANGDRPTSTGAQPVEEQEEMSQQPIVEQEVAPSRIEIPPEPLPEEAPAEEAVWEEPAEVAPEVTEPVVPPERPAEPVGDAAPTEQHQGFSLDGAGMVVAGCIILLLIVVGFVAGNKFGYDRARDGLKEQAVNGVDQARRMQPNGSVLSVNNQESSTNGTARSGSARKSAPASPSAPPAQTAKATESPSTPKVGRQIGWNYLLVQHFRGPDAQDEATRVERFVNAQITLESGLPTVTVEPHPDSGFMVLSTLGYSAGDSNAKEAFHRLQQAIVTIGKQYRQRGGGCDFRDAYAMKLTRVPAGNRRK